MPTGPLKVKKPKSQSGADAAAEFHRLADRLRSVVSGRASARLKSRSLTVSRTKRPRQILVGDSAEDDVANFLGYALDLIDRSTSARRQGEALRPPVGAVLASLDEARASSSESSRRTTEEPSRDSDAASSFCRIGDSERAIRSKGSQVASVSHTCNRPSTARRHSRATWATRGANRARASFGGSGMETYNRWHIN